MSVDSAGRGVVDAVNGSVPGRVPPSLVLAVDYRVDDVERTWSLIKDSHSPLVDLGAHHVVLYTSTTEPNRVLVTIGIRPGGAPITELLRSPAVFEWFDRAGVNDIPAIFAGAVREKIDLAASAAAVPGVIVGAVAHVGNLAALMANVHDGLERFRDAGVRRVWVYGAVDDRQEVLTLLEIDGAANAQRWIDQPDTAAEWMSGGPAAGYPRPFVGELAYVMTAEDATGPTGPAAVTNPAATRQG